MSNVTATMECNRSTVFCFVLFFSSQPARHLNTAGWRNVCSFCAVNLIAAGVKVEPKCLLDNPVSQQFARVHKGAEYFTVYSLCSTRSFFLHCSLALCTQCEKADCLVFVNNKRSPMYCFVASHNFHFAWHSLCIWRSCWCLLALSFTKPHLQLFI